MNAHGERTWRDRWDDWTWDLRQIVVELFALWYVLHVWYGPRQGEARWRIIMKMLIEALCVAVVLVLICSLGIAWIYRNEP